MYRLSYMLFGCKDKGNILFSQEIEKNIQILHKIST